jgi:hypothetical protein
MDAPYELSFRPRDEDEHQHFETVLHGFVALEAHKPEASSIFARYDSPSGCWVLAFDTHAALTAFTDHWRDRVARFKRPFADVSRLAPAQHTNGN